MNQAKDFREIKEFATGNKVRDLISKEIAPTVDRVEDEWNKIRVDLQEFGYQIQQLLKFQTQKETINKNIKQLNKEIFDIKDTIVSLKNDIAINKTKNDAGIQTIKTVIDSMERNLNRKLQIVQSYDQKFNQMMDSLAKHQSYVTDRLRIYQEKFKVMSKETYEMTKNVKKDFKEATSLNESIKNELDLKMKKFEARQKALDLYLAEREENIHKMIRLEERVRDCVLQKDLQEVKKVQNVLLDENFRKVQSFIHSIINPETENNLKMMALRFAQIQELKQKTNKIQDIKSELKSINMSIKSIELQKEQQFAQFKSENDEREEKMIETIDKKFQTIQDHLEQRGTQTEQSVEQKISKLRRQIQQDLTQRISFQNKLINQLKEVNLLTVNASKPEQKTDEPISQSQKDKFKAQTLRIKEVADGLQDKLTVFSHRIVMCKSDIELFSENTRKQLKVMKESKMKTDLNLENVGKILSQMMETLMMLTSLTLNADCPKDNNKFVTFSDGLILEIDNKISEQQIIYRRKLFNVTNLKQSLLYSLINLTDEIVSNFHSLKWNENLPSDFFKAVKQNIEQRQKCQTKNHILSFYSSKKVQKAMQQDDAMFEMKRQNTVRQYLPTSAKATTISNVMTVYPIDHRPTSNVEKRQQLKKSGEEEKSRKKSIERNCFTSSRSHRKTKLTYL